MVSVHRTPKSGLFLLELMIIILFFAVTSALCVRIFVTAHLTSRWNLALNQAMLTVQTAAECVKDAGGDQQYLLTLLPLTPLGDGSFAAYYDSDWTPAQAEASAYTLFIQQNTDSNNMLTAHVEILDGEASIFGLSVKRYLGKNGGVAP